MPEPRPSIYSPPCSVRHSCPPLSLLPFRFLRGQCISAIYALSLHDALPISVVTGGWHPQDALLVPLTSTTGTFLGYLSVDEDRKSTRLNSSHLVISYAVLSSPKKPAPKSLAYHSPPGILLIRLTLPC